MAAEEKAYFECPVCSYQDFMGNTMRCPVCDPEPEEDKELCFFVNAVEGTCSQDLQPCPFAESKRWGECEKLAGYDPRRAYRVQES